MRYMSYADTYVIYVEGGRGIAIVILHDIGMCRKVKVAS